MKSTPKRIRWIDASKGVAIFFIVCGHCADKNGADRILLHISMFTGVAVFFILSGMTFCWKEGNFLYFDRRPFRTFMASLLCGIVLPYFFWSLVSIVMYQIFGAVAVRILGSDRNHFSLIGNLIGMLYGNSGSGYMEWNRPLWFLTCLAVTELLWYFLLRSISNYTTKKKPAYILIAAVCLGSTGWFLYSNLHGIQLCLPWELETAFCVFPFLGVGRFLRLRISGHKMLPDRKQCVRRYALASVCVICLWMLLLGVEDADFRADRFTDPWLFYPESVLGITAVIAFARAITVDTDTKLGRLLVYMGQRTMAILVMHKFVIMAERILLSRMGVNLADIFGYGDGGLNLALVGLVAVDISSAVVVILLCLAAEHVLVKAVPAAFGNRRR